MDDFREAKQIAQYHWKSSSTTYCTTGLRPSRQHFFRLAFISGSTLVPSPATGTIAMLIDMQIILRPAVGDGLA